MISLNINGTDVLAKENQTILQTARENGIYIPTLCYLEGINEIGSCRVCVVEIEGQQTLAPACETRVREGMVIQTESPRVVEARKSALQLILAHHKRDCNNCVKSGDCELSKLFTLYEIEEPLYPTAEGDFTKPKKTGSPFLQYNPDLCISCQRCVSTCAKVTGRHAITAGKSGNRFRIDAPFGLDWKNTMCESCGCCAQACPTGALVDTRRNSYRSWEVKRVTTICPHCAVGCQMDLLVKDGKIVGVEGADGPSNRSRLCVKGRFSSTRFVQSADRLTTPLIKDRSTGRFRSASWDEALDLVAEKFTELKNRYGGDALAGFACSRSTNEDIYMLQKMTRTVFGTNNTDNCARV